MTEAIDNEIILKMENIEKTFPGVHALKNVHFDLKPGEVHVLLGENGAGKSTLMKILCGTYKADSGKIILEGSEITINNPYVAQAHGISMIYQELMLAENVAVFQNIMMGREVLKSKILGLVDVPRMKQDADAVLNGLLKAGIDVSSPTDKLSVAQKQLVEIAKAVLRGSKIIIMDEPTSSLTDKDVTVLFETISKLKKRGTAIVYISHKMEEIKQIADRVTVLRDGEYIDTVNMCDTNIDDLIRMMVGRNLSEKYPKELATPGEIALSVKNLCRQGVLHDITFTARRGEILGIFGLIGSGRTELCRAIFGADAIDSGEIEVFSKKVKHKSPKDAIANRIGLIPEDRKLDGLVGIMDITFNINLPILRLLKKGISADFKRQKEIAKKYVDILAIKTPGLKSVVRNLSGGNQQKVVVAKWLASQSDIIFFDEPTRGIDVGAKIEIYKIMNDLLKKGVCIIMISSEMPELLGISDRILVMRRGKISAEFTRDEATQQEVLKWAL